MIQLTKRNHEKFLVNHLQIEHIECIPESKITMMNHDYYLVRESVEEIINKIAVYNAGHPPGNCGNGQALSI